MQPRAGVWCRRSLRQLLDDSQSCCLAIAAARPLGFGSLQIAQPAVLVRAATVEWRALAYVAPTERAAEATRVSQSTPHHCQLDVEALHCRCANRGAAVPGENGALPSAALNSADSRVSIFR